MATPVEVVGTIIEAMRTQFTSDAATEPLGGAVPTIEHRPGADVALDGLEYENCAGIVWVNVLRMFRTTEWPQESDSMSACRGTLAVVVQVGAARCVSTVDSSGFPPTPEDMERDALVGLDDAVRLERALCIAARWLEQRGIGNGSVVGSSEPYGPAGGVLAWTKTLNVQLG